MAKKPLKPCREIGCNNLTRDTYCETHKNVPQKLTRKYNKYVRDKRTTSFYNSYEWQKLRALVFARDKRLCQRCLKDGRVKQADVVHHIVEVKDDWSKRLDLNNLVSLCHACHNAIHNRSPRG